MFTLESAVGNYITIRGQQYSYFAGNNYLGLANHPILKQAAIAGIERYGVNVAASRETTGTSALHVQLEDLLAEFKGKEAALAFASGYLGNKILLAALQDRYTTVFIDEAAHPSVLDGIPADIAQRFFYQHCSPDHLDSLLQHHHSAPALIITDGIFPLTGEIAPLDQISAIMKPYEAMLVVDDAHASGVLGEQGRGTPEHFQLGDVENVYQTETMSKALGGYGGFIAASQRIIEDIQDKSSAYIGSTALPPPIVAADCAAITYVMQHPERRTQLLENMHYLRKNIQELGFSTSDDPTPIIPIFFDSQEEAEQLSGFFHEHYIIAPAIHYPVKMEKFLVRMTVSASHTTNQIEQVITCLTRWREKYAHNPH